MSGRRAKMIHREALKLAKQDKNSARKIYKKLKSAYTRGILVLK